MLKNFGKMLFKSMFLFVVLFLGVGMEVERTHKQIEFGFGTVVQDCFRAKLNLTSYLRRI